MVKETDRQAVPELLAGRTALVTGGTRGIGRGIAEVLHAAGARVVITGRDAGTGEKVAAGISGRDGRCRFRAADVRSQQDMTIAAGYAAELFGSLDILVHNAGVYPEVRLEAMTEADWDLVHDTNLKSAFFALRASLELLKQSPAGRIVFVSSITGPVTGYPGLAHYGASKAGINGLMRTAAIEVAPFGITVNAVAPGSIATEGLADLGAGAIAAMVALIPLKRLGHPRDVANAVLYLASDLASFVTGQSLIIDGGQILPEIPGLSMARWAFDGRVAFVTGAGGGMGARIAADLARGGARVFAIDVKEEPVPRGDWTYWRFDVTDEARVAGALDEVFTGCGRLDYVVNGAGVGWFDRDGSVAIIDRDVWERVLDVNLTAAMLVCRHALPLVARTGGGAFVHLASVAGLRASDGPMDAYQVSKAGLVSLSRAVALQYGPQRIRSNTICPGAILTPMIQPLYDEDPARAERMANRTPLRRLGTVADVSSACQFLLSDEAAFITGIDLVVDGGWTLALA